ncbi:hypothetical protein L0664_04880 [Octadecabacter sp. G9-8]|uniref:DUF8173 domain-containing protein n=1 Tax=Octadecabacter dasysiphoniae TaxID=2909341 RepID=A0ABS9CWH9_9RHOB|nr:hypothetical protein [Octadecabacter dasysiphoniae]MCF2870393.1 hypothetical protein [Octadecabacter dasysiphoniae]
MSVFSKIIAAIVLIALPHAALADTVSTGNGDDTFFAGRLIDQSIGTNGDTFVTARSAQVEGAASGDLHVSGFDVAVDVDVAEDLYAMGSTVVIRGTVAEDLSVMAFSARTESSAEIGGNARLMGSSVTLDGPVAGALSVIGRDVILNARITGDVRISAQTLSFGPEAVVSGRLTYSTKEQITVPAYVAPEERVTFEQVTGAQIFEDWRDIGTEMPALPTFASMMFGFIISLLFFLALGALMLGFMPRRLARLRRSVAQAPGQTFMLGVIGLSMLFGTVPVTALTIVGLPFVPIALLAILVAWVLGYALGAYSVAMRVWAGLGGADDPSNFARLAILAAAITFIALLNFIPFVGWVANYTLVLLGIGAMTRAVLQSLIGNPDVAFDVDMKPIED